MKSCFRQTQADKKHNQIVLSRNITGYLANFLVKKDSNEGNETFKAEFICVFHNVTHAMSYNNYKLSLKCLVKKSAAIARNVLAPFVKEQGGTILNKVVYFSVRRDAS